MFSNNNRISTRQVFRLFVFDFIGMSTLVLPAKLAGTSGCDGVFAIVAGGLFASLYLWYLAWIMNRMDSDLITYVRQSLPRWGAFVMLCFFAAYCILEASYGAYIFADVMKKGLVGGESYTLLLLLILAVAAYAIQSGIESRARVYESLFWVLFVPLFLLLWIAASDVNTVYLHSFFTTPVSEVAGEGLLVFEYLMPVFLVLFFPAYVKKDAQKKMVAAVYRALWVAVLVFIVFDLILLGSFGERAMAKMRYPALTLMSNIHLRGSFLKRLDAFLLAIWFFTLFAFINVFLFYAKQLIAAIGGEFTGAGGIEHQGNGLKMQKEKNAKVWSTIIAFLLVFVVAEGFCYGSFAEWFEGYMTYVAIPLLILLPLIIVVWGKYRKTGNRSLQ
jgi:spore germination protein